MDKIKVMIVDDQAFFKAGLSQALSRESDIEILKYDQGQDTLETIENTLADAVLIGSDLSSQSGLGLGRRIVRLYPNTKVIFLSPNPNDTELFEAIKIAAAAYLSKNAAATEIVENIRRVRRGEYPINESLIDRPVIAGSVLKQIQSTASMVKAETDTVTASLTRRETEILNYIANGMSNKRIAGALDISEQTIKNHISSILRKLNANDRAHAVVLAIKHGWITIEETPANGQSP